MIPIVDKELDLVYGSDRQVYLEAVYNGNNSLQGKKIYEISTRDKQVRPSKSGS